MQPENDDRTVSFPGTSAFNSGEPNLPPGCRWSGELVEEMLDALAATQAIEKDLPHDAQRNPVWHSAFPRR